MQHSTKIEQASDHDKHIKKHPDYHYVSEALDLIHKIATTGILFHSDVVQLGLQLYVIKQKEFGRDFGQKLKANHSVELLQKNIADLGRRITAHDTGENKLLLAYSISILSPIASTLA